MYHMCVEEASGGFRKYEYTFFLILSIFELSTNILSCTFNTFHFLAVEYTLSSLNFQRSFFNFSIFCKYLHCIHFLKFQLNPSLSNSRYSFVCPNGTVFSQERLVGDHNSIKIDSNDKQPGLRRLVQRRLLRTDH